MIDPAEALDEYLDATNAPETQPFAIKDDREADWAVAKIVRRQAQIGANKKLAELRKQQIDDWFASVTHTLEAEMKFFEELLRPYLETRLADQKTKTLKLPSGAVSLRKSNPEFTIDGEKINNDNPSLVEYIRRSSPDFLKIKEYADWGELKKSLIATESGKVITSDGEILDFIQAWQPPDKIAVKGVLK
jgi:hypothetical protein